MLGSMGKPRTLKTEESESGERQAGLPLSLHNNVLATFPSSSLPLPKHLHSTPKRGETSPLLHSVKLNMTGSIVGSCQHVLT